MTPELAMAVLVVGLVLPLIHVAVSPKGGPWLPPRGARCPFGPRTGWLIIVLIAGPIGWLLYMRGRNRRQDAVNS